MILRSLAILTVIVGLIGAGWGPLLIESVTGATLPEPTARDTQAMVTWSAVGIFRVMFGLLTCLGASLLALTSDNCRRALTLGLFTTSSLVLVIAAAQQVAVWSFAAWTNLAGLTLVSAIGLTVLLSGVAWFKSERNPRASHF